MKTFILAIVLFCVMIFPHELGHFIAAKRMGVKVNEFAFGMGPVIWKKQRGETLHTIRLFPIGGFCAMEGEDDDSEDERAFSNKKPWQKLIVLAAGSFMNVICALLIMIIVVGTVGFTTTAIATVGENTPAAEAGFEAGDRITAIDGDKTESWEDISRAVAASEGNEMTFTVERDGREETLKASPEASEEGVYLLGVTSKVSHNPVRAVADGAAATWNMTKAMFQSLGQIFSGQVGADSLSGPVGMVQMVSETSQYGFWYYGFLTSLICMNLAIINMLPLPALDGGRIIFVLYTMITGRPVSQKVEGTVHFAGIVLLLGLMVYVTFNDITRIFS